MLIQNDETIREIMEGSRICAIHAEGRNARKAIDIARSLGRKFYLCHVGTESEIGYVKQNKKENVFVEVTPHHLFLTENDQSRLVKMKPSLKNESDRRSLWDALNDGTIDAIGSDHAPHTIEEKETSDAYGVPGVETRLPLMLDAVNKRRLTMRRMVETMCENPARIFSIKGKGFIKVGNDADLVMVDMKLAKKVRNDGLFTKCGWSPFDGYELCGWPVKTMVNGGVVFEDGVVYEENRGEAVEYG
jgi:dihydroorotase